MRAIAIGRKNWLFAGSERGGQSAAIAYTLIETAKLNGVDPPSLAHRCSRSYCRSQDHASRRTHAMVLCSKLGVTANCCFTPEHLDQTGTLKPLPARLRNATTVPETKHDRS